MPYGTFFDKCLKKIAVKYTMGHVVGMVGPINDKQKENKVNGYWANCVALTFTSLMTFTLYF